MDPDMINCMILHIHVEKKILSHAIQPQTSVSARYGSKKKGLLLAGSFEGNLDITLVICWDELSPGSFFRDKNPYKYLPRDFFGFE